MYSIKEIDFYQSALNLLEDIAKVHFMNFAKPKEEIITDQDFEYSILFSVDEKEIKIEFSYQEENCRTAEIYIYYDKKILQCETYYFNLGDWSDHNNKYLKFIESRE